MGDWKVPAPANTCSSANAALVEGASPARQLVFDGRAFRPDAGGGVVPDSVVALAAAEFADSFAGVAASKARTV